MRTRKSPKGGFTLLQVVLVLAALVFLALVLFPVFGRSRENAKKPSCPSNLKQIGLGFKLYIQDYDEKYPLAAAAQAETGWTMVLQPYLKSAQIFQCPFEQTPPQQGSTWPLLTDYWFNSRLSGVRESRLTDMERTISMGDGESSDARYHLMAIPQTWRNDTDSPLYRHEGNANFAFADGHVKRISPGVWKNELDAVPGYTFRIKPTN